MVVAEARARSSATPSIEFVAMRGGTLGCRDRMWVMRWRRRHGARIAALRVRDKMTLDCMQAKALRRRSVRRLFFICGPTFFKTSWFSKRVFDALFWTTWWTNKWYRAIWWCIKRDRQVVPFSAPPGSTFF